MGYYRTPLDVPPIYQWDQSSRLPLPDPGTAPGNCGPTVMTSIANYYKDRNFGIYDTRRLATASLELSTSIGDQSLMLAKRGVDNIISRPTVSQIKHYLSSLRRPLCIGMDMSKVPWEIAGHPFRGNHAVELLANTERDNTPGVLVLDPNFNRTYRTDPKKGRRFYPDWVLWAAYYNPGMWAIVPRIEKQVPPSWYGRVRILDGNNRHIRESAKEIQGNTWAISRTDGYTYAVNGNRLFRNAYEYYWNGEIREGFYVVRTHGGDTKFIKTPIGVVTRKP
jgi:hypothetical protein